MHIGFLIPTSLEADNVPPSVYGISAIGYGAGKVAACSAAADLIFNKHCDTIIIWGLAGGLSYKAEVGNIIIGDKVAYRDYNVAPLMDSTGVGWVQEFAENLFVKLDEDLRDKLLIHARNLFPGHTVVSGNICSGDQFINYTPDTQLNRIEEESDAVDMESAAVVHFCHNIDPSIKVGIVRVISDNANVKADIDFNKFLSEFAKMNCELNFLKYCLEDTSFNQFKDAIKTYPDFPTKGVSFKDMWGIFADDKTFHSVCYLMYDHLKNQIPDVKINKVAGIESRGFIIGHELARMLNVPFIPLRKKGKLPGTVISTNATTEYSNVSLEIKIDSLEDDDNVVVVDDVLATGGTLVAAKNLIELSGGKCVYAAVIGKISGLNGTHVLKDNKIPFGYLTEL